MSEPGKFGLPQQKMVAAMDPADTARDLPEQFRKRMIDLCDQYEVNDGDWLGLAFVLAMKHEPAFRNREPDALESTSGDGPAWTPMLHLFLWWDVTEYRKRSKSKLKNAIAAVSEHPDWAGYRINREQWYLALKSHFVEDMVNAESELGRGMVAEFMQGFLKNRKKLINHDES